ncbi:MAG: serine/threonine protein kinase, partial [Labilithrix sp.]|nr:serine/threonine protein kinase [Labilithrix sp.]
MPKLLATDGEGERLDRFELVAELASGGMATVYLARLSGVAGFQRLVAIKRLHPHLAKEPDFIEMFLDEARLAARIHHPNVVPIQEVGESGSGYYLVMDYVEGDTFARLLARAAQTKTRIPWGVTIRVLLDTLAGLHAAHELTDDLGAPLAIVHRDVSPQNILVGSDGIARITDFGVARAASRLSTTRSGQLKGKLAYMAPEQARGGEIDRRADLFSCGIVLWEALALKRLFKGDGEAATLNRVLYDPIAPPSSQRSDVPAALEAVCMRALERDVDKRFATAEEFADELERVARSLSCVGSVRDVAACLEEVFGSDLTQQRDAVRAWLARSEPSAAPRSRRSLPESSPTRVERGKSEPSSLRSAPGSAPSGSVERPAVDRLAVTAPAPADPSSFAGPDKVSSVSSAVLHVSGADATGAGIAASRRSPGRL